MIHAHADIDFSIPAMRQWWKLPEGTRAEVIDRKLYILSPPTLYHCRVSTRIAFELMRHVEEYDLGEVFISGVGTFLKGGTNALIPDVIFISNENELVRDRKGLFGGPDLVIEVLSPSTKRRDRTIKKDLYEQEGVKEYWLVDPVSKNTWGYLLENGSYDEPLLMQSEIYIRVLKKIIHF